MFILPFLCFVLSPIHVFACSSCYGTLDPISHRRLVRRMQPESLNTTSKPRGPLEWGQINFLQTTDTHGWLEGHLKERNYGADWGDFVSFVSHMRRKADRLKVDLLLIDTGDLHDGAGLSDATDPNGVISNTVFTNVEYDLLSIGNHELYVTDIAYETFSNFSKVYGERYLTSNVQIINKATGKFEDIGHKFRYFTTKHGLRIMAFGVLFDFKGNSNVTKVTKAADMVKEAWFKNAVNFSMPIDLFVVIGHNPVRRNATTSTFGTLYNAIRTMRPDIPIQAFGGHTHIRDFVVYDEMSTGLESGQYCETLGWLSLTGIQSPTFNGSMVPRGVPHPTRRAMVPATTSTDGGKHSRHNKPPISRKPEIRYARRYLDWNRLTFAFHALGSQDLGYDIQGGQRVTGDIAEFRKGLNLTTVFGCAPQTYCKSCKPFGSDGNIFQLLQIALAATVVNQSRAEISRLIIINTGTIRFDLVQGPFTVDDAFIVSPFKDKFQFIPDVPYSQASQVLGILDAGPNQKRSVEWDLNPVPAIGEVCSDPWHTTSMGAKRDTSKLRSNTRRKSHSTALTAGYTTTDDFGADGDDTPHSKIPFFSQPNDVQANASFPADGTMPSTVDLIFLDFIGVPFVLPALTSVGANYTQSDIQPYMPDSFTTNTYLTKYAVMAWQDGLSNCRVG